MKKDTAQTFLKFVIPIAVLVALAALSMPAMANYDYNGYAFPINTSNNGTINGEVYVGGGHGVEGESCQPNTYIQNFTIPYGTVTFARLYVGVWSGTETYNGWLNTTFNGHNLGSLTLNGLSDTNPNVWCTGHGVYWVYYDVTDNTTAGFNSAIARTGQIHSSFDGRIYGIVLVAAVENGDMTSVTYWINDGHWNLNEGHAHDRNTAWFNGTVDTTNTSATLTTVQLCGGSVYPTTGEPYYNSMDFNGDLLAYDAADGCGEDEWGNSWCGESSAFDIDEWDVSDYLTSPSNNATFDRGTDPYLHPVIAVLKVKPWYFKEPYQNPYRDGAPENTPPSGNYAPSGMPDFDQKQDKWRTINAGLNGTVDSILAGDDVLVNPAPGPYRIGIAPGPNCVLDSTLAGDDRVIYSFCGPTAVANCFWWFDSKFGNHSGYPGDGVDDFPLVSDYGAGDDHSTNNVPLLVCNLANCMSTTSTGTTNVFTMQQCIDDWLNNTGLNNTLYERTVHQPNFWEIEEEVKKSEDVILLLGFWENQSGIWNRIGGHYVTVAGVNSRDQMIAFSDPFFDNAEAGGPGVVPIPHPPHPLDPTIHNDAQYVSHDFYTVTPDSPSPGGDWQIPDYNVSLNTSSVENFQEEEYQGGPIHTEIEYAVVVSPKPDLEIIDNWIYWPNPCIIGYKLKNTGGAPICRQTTHYVNLSLDGVEMNHVVPISMPAQNGVFVGFFDVGTGNMPCSADVKTCADFNYTVDESNENNNCRTKDWMCGDVRKDGSITGRDVSKLNSYVNGIGVLEIELKWAGDVRTDGYITGRDVSKLNNYVCGSGTINCMCTQTCP